MAAVNKLTKKLFVYNLRTFKTKKQLKNNDIDETERKIVKMLCKEW